MEIGRVVTSLVGWLSRACTRPTSRSRKLLQLAEDILRLASRLAAAYGLRLRLTAKIG